MTCVRTTTGGCLIAASEVLWGLEPARSARALSTPAANIVTAAAILVWVIRIGFSRSVAFTALLRATVQRPPRRGQSFGKVPKWR
jgi:hypothetical protein